MVIQRIPNPLFATAVVLIVGMSFEMLNKWLDVHIGEGHIMCHTDAAGAQFVFNSEIKDYDCRRLIWVKEFDWNSTYDHGVLGHEVLHYVAMVLRDRGVTLADPSEEVYTHFFEYAHRECLTILQKEYNKKRKYHDRGRRKV